MYLSIHLKKFNFAIKENSKLLKVDSEEWERWPDRQDFDIFDLI